LELRQYGNNCNKCDDQANNSKSTAIRYGDENNTLVFGLFVSSEFWLTLLYRVLVRADIAAPRLLSVGAAAFVF
jgi:hypothetical protein